MSIQTLLISLGTLGLFEFLLGWMLKSNGIHTKVLSVFLVGMHSFIATMILFSSLSFWSLGFAILTFFRIISVARVAVDRTNPKELRIRFRRSAVIFFFLSVVNALLLYENPQYNWLRVASLISLIFSCVFVISLLYSYRKYKTKENVSASLKQIPTVSVCIPARNETQDLPECIETVLASTYPKLEILVLDDCSHDKTPAIIKEYAHRGVRFLSGQEPTDGWLAKNKAMDKLFDESTGEIVIFAGVDVRFSADSIQQIVAQLGSGNRMISVLPKRTESSEWSVFIQPLRYWWEIALPRVLTKRPPVLSTTWAIYRQELYGMGGFDGVRGSVQPEAHFAKRLRDVYRFLMSGKTLGITSVKPPKEQHDTAVRTRYPQLKRRPETVLFVIALEMLIFVTPIIALLFWCSNSALINTINIVSLILLVSANVFIGRLIVRRTWWLGLVSLPALLIEEWYVLLRSMLAYEFGTVIWKERNICLPMLRVEKSLPSLEKSS